MFERIFLFSIAIAFTGGLVGCSHAPTYVNEGRSSYFGDAKVQRYRLTNGLKVLVLEDHAAPTFSYQTWFRVGSTNEEKGLTGLAHLFEHMMFKGTKTLKEGEFDRILEAAGAEGENAFTSRDFTAYVQSMPSDKLDLIARLEADRMVNLIVNDDSLNKEREVVQNERRFRSENSPDGQLYEKLFELAFTKHSYHWPVIGYEADLRNAKQVQCEAFYKRYYAPNNATVVVVGDVHPEKVIAVIEKYYSMLPASKIERHTGPKEPEQKTERTQTTSIKAPIEKLMVGYHGPTVSSREFAALEVLRNILAGGKSARLYRRLVDSGIATGVDIENDEKADPGLFIILSNMQKGKTAKQALAEIDDEISRLTTTLVTQEEIARAISMYRFSLFDGLASNYSKAQLLGFYETVAGRFEHGIEMINALSFVDRSAVQKVAKTFLRRENRSVLVGTPAAEKTKESL